MKLGNLYIFQAPSNNNMDNKSNIKFHWYNFDNDQYIENIDQQINNKLVYKMYNLYQVSYHHNYSKEIDMKYMYQYLTHKMTNIMNILYNVLYSFYNLALGKADKPNLDHILTVWGNLNMCLKHKSNYSKLAQYMKHKYGLQDLLQ